jgi:flavin reductase (DIM6/NTAB) family NADH-FMN oxidoreductase RutF
MTVSSFNTVTLCPEPIVSFNVKLPSETYNAIQSSCRFLVHLLAPNRATAQLAQKFSRGNWNILLDGYNGFFRFQSPRNPGRQPSITEGEPPRLVIQHANVGRDSSGINTPDFPFIFECQYLPQSVKVGNHVIVLGTVVDVFYQDPDSDPDNAPNNLCLTYADTRFWKMGEKIFLDPHKS